MINKVVAIAAFLIFFQIWFYGQIFFFPGTVGWAVFVTGWAVFLAVVFGTKTSKEAYLYSLVGVTLAWLSCGQADGLVTSVAWVGVWLFGGLTIFSYLSPTGVIGSLGQLVMVPVWLGQAFLVSVFTNRRSWLQEAKISRFNLGPVVRGLVIGLPIVVILGGLLSADPVFDYYFGRTFSFLAKPSVLVGRVVTVVGWLVVLIPLVDMKIRDQVVYQVRIWSRLKTEIGVVVGSVVALVGWFLVVQFQYLFVTVPETQLSKYGVNTYSEYVAKGFGELLVASVVIYVVVAVGLAVYRATNQPKSLLWLNLAACGELALVLASVLKRVVVYTQIHGQTIARIYGVIFLVWLALMVMVLIVRFLKQANWLRIELGLVALGLVSLVVVNAEAIVVANPPHVNNEIDYLYLTELSADGVEGWLQAYTWAKTWTDQHENSQTFSADDIRHRYYAHRIVRMLLTKESQLLSQLAYVEKESGGIISYRPVSSWQQVNFGRKAALKRIDQGLVKEDLNMVLDKLDRLEERMEAAGEVPAAVDRAPGRFFSD